MSMGMGRGRGSRRGSARESEHFLPACGEYGLHLDAEGGCETVQEVLEDAPVIAVDHVIVGVPEGAEAVTHSEALRGKEVQVLACELILQSHH